MRGFQAIVLAAGLGTRMRSKLPKVIHEICGKPMIDLVLDALEAAGAERAFVVVGHLAELVESVVGSRAQCVLQAEQKGTGHAVMQVRDVLSGYDGTVVVAAGDAAYLRESDLRALVNHHQKTDARATVLTAILEDPSGYGRVAREASGRIRRIVEDEDCSPEEALICEVNSSVYCFERRDLFDALSRITPDNVQGEYYLTDVIEIMIQDGLRVEAVISEDPLTAQGINTRVQLAEAEKVFRDRIREHLMLSGVTIVDPQTTFVDFDVVIGQDTKILPFSIIQGKTIIGKNCTIGPFTRIIDSKVSSGATISNAVVTEAEVGEDVCIGPYAYLRSGTVLAERAKVGTFVEVKKSTVGKGSKVSHQAYVGDATVGEGVNIGAGTITCNYDGHSKHPTIISDGAFVGSNANLVAPVKIGKRAYVAAGSTITQDVPDGALGIARGRQKNIDGWAEKRFKERRKSGSQEDSGGT
ncbi:MAG: bifunctional UDP-N-acetylglucosamine diphosphorylase/glucosamine-1-phosphate N-acetyltransferase GlmU [Firmicutes bacterium]|nr:bifunctional UDP-N-acetylglucosamine diphosphorylase/glucosamine-1-phosphate N-acetyltransferase GlmU [Bacillota bacterium]